MRLRRAVFHAIALRAAVLPAEDFVAHAVTLSATAAAAASGKRSDTKGGTRLQYLAKYLSKARAKFVQQLNETATSATAVAAAKVSANENADTEYAMQQTGEMYNITQQLQQQSTAVMNELLQVSDAFLKVSGSGEGGNEMQCGNVRCGQNGICTQTTRGAQCLCAPGFFGDGLKCLQPPTYRPKPLLSDGESGADERIHDVAMTAVGNGRVAIVYRNSDRSNRGYLLLGTVVGTSVEFATPEMFSFMESGEKTEAWEPSVVGEGTKIVVSFRTARQDGDCMAISADLDTTMGKSFLEWSPAARFCQQSASHPLAGQLFLAQNLYVAFGNNGEAVLFDLERFKIAQSAVDPVQFSDLPVRSVQAVKMGPSAFLLEFARAPKIDETSGATLQQEAVLMYGMLAEGALTFLPGSVSAEPSDMKQITARDLASVSATTAYLNYAVGSSGVSVFKTLLVNPKAKKKEPKLQWVTTRQLKHPGMVPFMSAVTSPTPGVAAAAPMVISFYAPQGEKQTLVEFCPLNPVTAEVDQAECQERSLAGPVQMKEMRAVDIGEGKLVLVFTDEQTDAASYMMFGLF
eukprot:g2791.t1